MSDEIDLVTLESDEWTALLDAAAELDLVRGGLFRARPGAVLFYASPETAPAGWPHGFPDGSPELPRALVGEAEVLGVEETNQVTIRLTVSNWSAARSVKEAYERGDYGERYQEFVLAQEAALRGRREDREWLRGQFRRLQAHASGALLRDEG